MSKTVDMPGIARALETIARFIGHDGFGTVNELLVKIMRNRKIIGLGYVMHSGAYYQIRLQDHA